MKHVSWQTVMSMEFKCLECNPANAILHVIQQGERGGGERRVMVTFIGFMRGLAKVD